MFRPVPALRLMVSLFLPLATPFLRSVEVATSVCLFAASTGGGAGAAAGIAAGISILGLLHKLDLLLHAHRIVSTGVFVDVNF